MKPKTELIYIRNSLAALTVVGLVVTFLFWQQQYNEAKNFPFPDPDYTWPIVFGIISAVLALVTLMVHVVVLTSAVHDVTHHKEK